LHTDAASREDKDKRKYPVTMYDYESVEKKLRIVLAYFATRLTGEFVDQITEFIDHDEYGEAYDLLCHILASENQRMQPDIYAMIVELGQQMKMSNDIWEKLKPLSEHA
jgi:hypothetical protein